MPQTLTRNLMDKVEYSNIYNLLEDSSAFFFSGKMAINADGAYKAYHRNNTPGLDYLGNAGEPGNWWAIVTDNGKTSGNPLIQKTTDPAPGFYISTTAYQDATKQRTDPRKNVDSVAIPFIVLPKGKKLYGAALGDLAIVYSKANKKITGAILADIGPKNSIGEASIACADLLSVNSNPKNGGTGAGIIYIVFPNTKQSFPLTADAINIAAKAAFAQWGGMAKLKQVMPEYV